VIVCKFGGTSVGDAEAIARTATIIGARRDRQPVVVVSALAGATNALLAIAEQAARGQLIGALRAIEELRERHLTQSQLLLAADQAVADDICAELSAMFDELAMLADALNTLGDLTPRSLDAIASLGEQISSVLVVAAFRLRGLPATHVDARQIVIPDENYTKAEPQPDAIAEAAQRLIAPLLRDGQIPVMGGYIGSARSNGVTTTLGRGGSDYSASLVGAAMQADAIEIWTDVDGMLTADPRVVPAPRVVPQLSFAEASELAYFGAKVLHPSTILPAVSKNIPVRILNSHRPDNPGTLITADPQPTAGHLTAIACKRDVTVIDITSSRMLMAHGFLRRLFEVFERYRTAVDVVTTSEVSVSVTVDDTRRLEEIVGSLRTFSEVACEPKMAIVSVVGERLLEDTALFGRAIVALGGVPLRLVSQAASRRNITFVIRDVDVTEAMNRLHDAFF